jgi:exodeoxyribonuclease VII large subunit
MAIAESRIPVISAVGHEVDFSLSDFAADVRAPTPSAAAEMVSASRLELTRTLEAAREGLREAMRARLERLRLVLAQFEPEAMERHLRYLLQPTVLRVDDARQELADGLQALLRDHRHRLELLAEAVQASSPLGILARGYAVVVQERTGKALLSPAGLKPEEMLQIRLHRGGVRAAMKEKLA